MNGWIQQDEFVRSLNERDLSPLTAHHVHSVNSLGQADHLSFESAVGETKDSEARRDGVADQFFLAREKLNAGGWASQYFHFIKSYRKFLVNVTGAYRLDL